MFYKVYLIYEKDQVFILSKHISTGIDINDVNLINFVKYNTIYIVKWRIYINSYYVSLLTSYNIDLIYNN